MKDILKRLYTIENILLQMTDVIDIARNYEDRLTALESQPQPQRNVTMSQNPEIKVPKQEEILAIKASIIQKAGQHYNELIQFLKRLPLDQNQMIYAYVNFDQGMHWVEKIVQLANLRFETVAQPAQQNTPEASEQAATETQPKEEVQ